MVIEKLETELKELRTRPFLEEDFEGRRQCDQDLIEKLQRADRITGDDLLRRLDINPSETDLVSGIDTQLQQLEAYGLVRRTPQGWVWER